MKPVLPIILSAILLFSTGSAAFAEAPANGASSSEPTVNAQTETSPEESSQDAPAASPEEAKEAPDAEIEIVAEENISLDLGEVTELIEYHYSEGNLPKAAARGISGFELGSEIPSYVYKNGKLSNWDQSAYYPAYCGSDMVGTLLLSGINEGDPGYSYSEEYADEVNEAVAAGHSPFCFIISKNCIFIKSGNWAGLLAEYPHDGVSAKNDTGIIAALPDQNLQYYTPKEFTEVVPASFSQARIVTGCDVTCTFQNGFNNCWAHAIVAIGNYEKGLTKTADSFTRQVGKTKNQTASIEEASAFMSASQYGYGISNTVSPGILAKGEIQSWIDQDHPIYMSWVATSTTGKGHATTLRGYYTNNLAKISIMDSANSKKTYRTVNINKNGDYILNYLDGTVRWNKYLEPEF